MRIFISGTMRSGNSLVSNILSIHEEILILKNSIHFFRLFYNHYDPLKDKKNLKKLIYHSYLFMKYRKGITLDIDMVEKILLNKDINYKNIYDAIATSLLNQTNKKIWGENCALTWRYIPKFIEMFDDAKSIHIVRDPRAVFSSWKKLSSIPNNAYINCIFNWIDSTNHIIKFKESLPTSKYYAIKYEDFMTNTKNTLDELFSYLGISFDENVLDQTKWMEKIKLNKGLVNIPRSAHEGLNILGFSSKRISNWKNHLEDWEILLIEFLCQKNMDYFGYEKINSNFNYATLNKIFVKLFSNDLLINNLKQFLKNGEGTDRYPQNPRDPYTWGAKHNPSEWFKDTDLGKEYFTEKMRIDKLIEDNEKITL